MNAEEKYGKAIGMYRDTDLTLGAIAGQCGVSRGALSVYIYRNHRDLLLKRNGITDADPQKTIRQNKGQRPETVAKYREAIEACDNMDYIRLNISQIAAKFGLSGTALANQLHAHYPEVIPRREMERERLGIAGNVRVGARQVTKEMYAEAVRLLHDTDLTIEEAAEKGNVPEAGLHQYLRHYNRQLLEEREKRRIAGKELPKIGKVSGNGSIRKVSEEAEKKYAEGVELYRDTSLPVTEIAQRIGVNVNSFRNHLRKWHRQLMFERRGAELKEEASDRASFDGTKRYNKATVDKYAEAIELLKEGYMSGWGQPDLPVSVEGVARKFGFVPEVFRAYLKEHEPVLFESLGMITLPGGRTVLRRSYEKYAKAIEEFRVGDDTLKNIARREGLTYNSLSGFIRRNFPELTRKLKIKN